MERILPGVIGLLAWGVPSAYLVRLVWLARRSRRWPSTNGSVITSELRNHPHFLGDSRKLLHVIYRYTVDGKPYIGHRARFGDWLSTNPFQLVRITSRFPPGAIVGVRYDPKHPHVSTLERRLSKVVWLYLGIGLFQMITICGALIGWWT